MVRDIIWHSQLSLIASRLEWPNFGEWHVINWFRVTDFPRDKPVWSTDIPHSQVSSGLPDNTRHSVHWFQKFKRSSWLSAKPEDFINLSKAQGVCQWDKAPTNIGFSLWLNIVLFYSFGWSGISKKFTRWPTARSHASKLLPTTSPHGRTTTTTAEQNAAEWHDGSTATSKSPIHDNGDGTAASRVKPTEVAGK